MGRTLSALQCPDCGSSDVEICNWEGDRNPGDQAELECHDCGNIEVITKVPLDEVFKA